MVKLTIYSQAATSRCLEELLETRLLTQPNQEEWIERAAVMQLYICTSSNPPTSVESLHDFFDAIHRSTKKPFGPSAAIAAHTLLWKQLETDFEQKQWSQSEGWCHLALHPIFDKSGEYNLSKIARKSIMCALERQDHQAAQEIYDRLPESGKDAPQTRYLMYKVAIRNGDAHLAAECLDVICDKPLEDVDLLYACVVEAQRSGDKGQAVAALSRILAKCEQNPPKDVKIAALIRYSSFDGV